MLRKRWYIFIVPFLLFQIVLAYPDSAKNGRMFYGIGAGLGVTLINSTSVVDYLNTNYSPPSKIDDFGVAAEFFGFGTFQISESWGGKLEYAYLIKSYNIPAAPMPDYTFSYNVHLPTVLAQYYLIGEGFIFKFGGGIGYHFAQFSRNLNVSNIQYKSSGLGVKLEVEGNTAFDDNLFATIALDMRDNFMNEFKDPDGKKLINSAIGKIVRMSFFCIGLKFGVVYYI